MAERCQSTSAPAQKLSPSPASSTARASPTSAKASVSSRISAASKALRRSGRARVIQSNGPSRSIRSAAMTPQLKTSSRAEVGRLPLHQPIETGAPAKSPRLHGGIASDALESGSCFEALSLPP
jgi:hypothetical protein